MYGALFENLIFAEIMKIQAHSGKKPNVYFWRDNNGVEIHCLVENANGQLSALEIKGGATINSDYLKNIKKFLPQMDNMTKYVIYTGQKTLQIGDVKIVGWNDISSVLKKVVE